MKRTEINEKPDGSLTIVAPNGERFVLFPKLAVPCGRWWGSKPKRPTVKSS